MGQEYLAQHRPFEGAECLIPHTGPFAATADGLSGWVSGAGAGRLCVYARAQQAPRGVGARAHRLMLQGLITLQRTRHAPGSPLFDFAARRTALPFAKARPVAANTTLPAEARLLLDLLVRFADDRRRCPTNPELAALLGVRSADLVSKHLAKLDQANLISIIRYEDLNFRQIEILETGAKTGMPS